MTLCTMPGPPSFGETRDIKTINSELRLLAALRRALRAMAHSHAAMAKPNPQPVRPSTPHRGSP